MIKRYRSRNARLIKLQLAMHYMYVKERKLRYFIVAARKRPRGAKFPERSNDVVEEDTGVRNMALISRDLCPDEAKELNTFEVEAHA